MRSMRPHALSVLSGLLILMSYLPPLVAQAKRPLPERVSVRHWTSPVKPVQLIGGFWRVDHTFESELQISNRLVTDSITVRPILILDDGTSFPLETVVLEPSGTTIVNLNRAFNALPAAMSASHHPYGTVNLSYDWHWDSAISAEVQNIDSRRSLSYVSGLRRRPDPVVTDQTIHGLWWKKTKSTTAFFRLTNVTSSAIKVQFSITDRNNQPIGSDSVVVGPSRTVLHDVRSVLSAESGATGGLDIFYTGHVRGLIVDGGLEDANNGFSASLPLRQAPTATASAKLPKQVMLASTGIMIGQPGPGQMFPSQVYFRPWLKLRNVSSSAKDVTVTGTYMLGFKPVTVPITQLTVNSLASSDVDVESMIHALNLPPQVMEVNLAISFLGYSSDLVVSSGSVDDAGSFVFEVPPAAVGLGGSKHICLWKADGEVDTMVSVWNHDSQPQDLSLIVHYSGGSYTYPIHLDAQSSSTVDLFDILHSGKPDAHGNTIPSGIESGSASLEGAAGEVEEINVTLTAASYDVGHATCVTRCLSCNGFADFGILPLPWDSPLLQSLQLYGYGHHASGNQYDLTARTTWSSNNTNVANVANGTSAGLMSPVSPGSAVINGTTDNLPLAGQICDQPPDCGDLYGPLDDQAPGTVNPTFTVAYSSYIPVDHLQLIADGCSYNGINTNYIYMGDAGRGTARTFEGITMTPGSSGSATAYYAGCGQTRQYAYGSPGNGSTLSSLDEDNFSYDCYLWNAAATASSAGFTHSETYSTNQGQELFIGSAGNPLESLAGPITWNMNVLLDTTNVSAPTATVNYNHTCFPSHHVVVNGTEVYSWTPSSTSFAYIALCLGGYNKVIGQTSAISVPTM